MRVSTPPVPLPAYQPRAGDTDSREFDPARRFLLINAVPAWLVSMVFHLAVLLLLAIWYVPIQDNAGQREIVSLPKAELPPVEDLQLVDLEPVEVEEITTKPLPTKLPTDTSEELPSDYSVTTNLGTPPAQIKLSDFADKVAPDSNLAASISGMIGQGLQSRTAEMKAELLKKTGGTAKSEEAVALALQWLAKHQLPNGSWTFDLRKCRNCNCRAPGSIDNGPNAATAMALLPFLGAGQTHVQGEYKETVRRGIYYLVNHMQNGRMWEPSGRMYSHGLASITLCEAYAMTDDRNLQEPAQKSLNFIVFAQDPVGGGWRYQPKQAGDTSVVGWQLMALKSGHMGYLQVPGRTIMGASRFLDSVQTDRGAKYGYASPGGGEATTAIGLLCRMYLGWDRQHPALARGVKYLSDLGPQQDDMYYNYYATQVLRHWGGEEWVKWNSTMRYWLVSSQVKKNHETGSWFMGTGVSGGGRGRRREGDHGFRVGGRLYCTSLATMILEVYYRHMPLYAEKAAEEEFPL